MQENFLDLIRASAQQGVSDLHFVKGKIYRRLEGQLSALPPAAEYFPGAVRAMTAALLNHQEKFFRSPEKTSAGKNSLPTSAKSLLQTQGAVDFALTVDEIRLRVNIYQAEQELAAAIRILPEHFPSVEELRLESIARRLDDALADRAGGLVLVTGSTGSGKSTTLAALMDWLLRCPRHAVTLEDPIEYMFTPGHEASFISRRELGRDFFSFAQGIRQSLREMPDLLLVGEIRDEETMTAALMAAESGVLVLASLHTGTAPGAVERVAGFYAPDRQPVILRQLSQVITAVIAQRLVPDKKGRRAVHEILTATPAVRNLIRTGNTAQLISAIVSGSSDGMVTFEQSMSRP